MSIGFALIAAIAAPIVGGLHSFTARKYALGDLYVSDPGGDEKRRILALIWHGPSAIWTVTALCVLGARLSGESTVYLSVAAIFMFALSGIGNLVAHRSPFIGGIILIAIAVLIGADAAAHANGAWP